MTALSLYLLRRRSLVQPACLTQLRHSFNAAVCERGRARDLVRGIWRAGLGAAVMAQNEACEASWTTLFGQILCGCDVFGQLSQMICNFRGSKALDGHQMITNANAVFIACLDLNHRSCFRHREPTNQNVQSTSIGEIAVITTPNNGLMCVRIGPKNDSVHN